VGENLILPERRAAFHVVPRGLAGSGFLAMLLFDKCGQNQPLYRQAERFAQEGVPLSPVDAHRSGWRGRIRAHAHL
jgi:transposase